VSGTDSDSSIVTGSRVVLNMPDPAPTVSIERADVVGA